MINLAATFRGVVVDHTVNATKKGNPQLAIKFRALEMYDANEKVWIDYQAVVENEMTGYLVMFKADGSPIFHVADIQKVFEWDGASLVGLDQLDLEGAEVQFEVITDNYEGKDRLKVARIAGYNDVPGSGGVKKLDEGDLAKMNAQFGNALKKLSGGPKAASAAKPTTAPAAPAKTKKAKATAPPKAPTKTEAETAAQEVIETPFEGNTEEIAKTETKKAPPKPPTTKKKPPAAPKAAAKKDPAADAVYTYESSWAECNERKQENVTDDQLASAFTAAMYRIAPGKDETEIEGSDWGLITEAVVNETGSFV
jgi:hypothetical protein